MIASVYTKVPKQNKTFRPFGKNFDLNLDFSAKMDYNITVLF